MQTTSKGQRYSPVGALREARFSSAQAKVPTIDDGYRLKTCRHDGAINYLVAFICVHLRSSVDNISFIFSRLSRSSRTQGVNLFAS